MEHWVNVQVMGKSKSEGHWIDLLNDFEGAKAFVVELIHGLGGLNI